MWHAVLLLLLLSDGEPAVVFEHEQRADDVLQVILFVMP